MSHILHIMKSHKGYIAVDWDAKKETGDICYDGKQFLLFDTNEYSQGGIAKVIRAEKDISKPLPLPELKFPHSEFHPDWNKIFGEFYGFAMKEPYVKRLIHMARKLEVIPIKIIINEDGEDEWFY